MFLPCKAEFVQESFVFFPGLHFIVSHYRGSPLYSDFGTWKNHVMQNSHLWDCRGSPTKAKIPHLGVHEPNLQKVGTALKSLQNKKGPKNVGYPKKNSPFFLIKGLLFVGYPKIFWPFLFWKGFSTVGMTKSVAILTNSW